jgi:hypothetical protein
MPVLADTSGAGSFFFFLERACLLFLPNGIPNSEQVASHGASVLASESYESARTNGGRFLFVCPLLRSHFCLLVPFFAFSATTASLCPSPSLLPLLLLLPRKLDTKVGRHVAARQWHNARLLSNLYRRKTLPRPRCKRDYQHAAPTSRPGGIYLTSRPAKLLPQKLLNVPEPRRIAQRRSSLMEFRLDAP